MKAFSSVSSPFLSNMFPHPGETIRIRIALSSIPSSVELCFDSITGLISRKPMTLAKEERNAYFFEAGAEIPNSTERFTYFFCIRPEEGEPFYYAKNGQKRWSPKVSDRFIITPGVTYPEWIAGRTCYQILPDRFSDGNPSIDYEEGEYEFDGTAVKTLKFGEKPLYFNEGRCLDFYSGDIKGMEDKLDYLKSLGFDTIYTNPINASLTIHRYDSIDFFHVDPHLGGDEAFASFCRALHEKGFRIIVDISINHTGLNHPWFQSVLNDPDSPYKEFYYRNGDGTFRFWQGVPTLPQLNYNSGKLRDIIYRGTDSAMQKYLKAPYFIDGWRMDVAPEVARAGKDQLCHEIWRELRKAVKSVSRDAYILGEAWDDSAEYLHGDEWDGIMNYFGAGRPLRAWMGEEDRFLSTGWGHNPSRIENFTSGEVIGWLTDALNTNDDQRAYLQMNLIDSHDTPRLYNHDEIMDDRTWLGTMLALYMLPGMPCTYYGDEVKLQGRMGSVEMSRYSMEWDEAKQDPAYKEWWRKLGEMRKLDGFAYSSIRFEEVSCTCFIIYRYIDDGSAVAAVINRSGEKIKVGLDSFMLGERMETLIGDPQPGEGLTLGLDPYESAAVRVF